MSARYCKSKRFPEHTWIEIKGFGSGTTGIPIGQAYSLRDALSACIDEWEDEQKEREKRSEVKDA